MPRTEKFSYVYITVGIAALAAGRIFGVTWLDKIGVGMIGLIFVLGMLVIVLAFCINTTRRLMGEKKGNPVKLSHNQQRNG